VSWHMITPPDPSAPIHRWSRWRLAETIDPDAALQIQIVVLGKLLQDADFTESQLEDFIGEVEQTSARFM
jgi:hypothetical protein